MAFASEPTGLAYKIFFKELLALICMKMNILQYANLVHFLKLFSNYTTESLSLYLLILVMDNASPLIQLFELKNPTIK